ncbi:hypothetical protein Mgra_00009756 [Meloidogyne graminicola]|uniref:Serpentine receptor class gamma n=1 Tax=Meloidogyne graminicola TaxID=189291 RepID=A0A8S9ZBU2_9BILA|nr:hypothetical protein Mgra_00009756 [Meloidogyne graminicola]
MATSRISGLTLFFFFIILRFLYAVPEDLEAFLPFGVMYFVRFLLCFDSQLTFAFIFLVMVLFIFKICDVQNLGFVNTRYYIKNFPCLKRLSDMLQSHTSVSSLFTSFRFLTGCYKAKFCPILPAPYCGLSSLKSIFLIHFFIYPYYPSLSNNTDKI